MGYKKACLAVVVLVLSFLVLLPATRSEAQGKVLKVGVLGPYTGPVALQGGEIKNAAIMAFENIGYKIGDYKIELVWIDSQSDPAKATNAYAEAVERFGIEASILGYHSSVQAALMDLFVKYKIPHGYGPVGSEIINEKYRSDPKYKGYIFKAWVSVGQVAAGYADFINWVVQRGVWKPENKRIALNSEDTDWGHSWSAGVKKAFLKSGWEVIADDYFPSTQTDFYPLISKYMKGGASIIGGTTNYLSSTAAFLKQRQELGYKGVTIADSLTMMGEWYSLTGRASDGILDLLPTYASPAAKAFAAAYEKKFNAKPGPVGAGMPYDGANFFIKVARRALEKYGKLDRETIHKIALEEVATGKLDYTAKDGAIMMSRYRWTEQSTPDPVFGPDDWFLPIVQYEGGQGKIVFPERMKEAEFKAPK